MLRLHMVSAVKCKNMDATSTTSLPPQDMQTEKSDIEKLFFVSVENQN